MFRKPAASKTNKKAALSLSQLCIASVASHLDALLAAVPPPAAKKSARSRASSHASRALPFKLRLQIIKRVPRHSERQIEWLMEATEAEASPDLALTALPLSGPFCAVISKKSARLTGLNLTSCIFATAEGVEAILTAATALTKVCLAFTSLDDNTLIKCIAPKKTIISLDIRGCSNLTDQGIVSYCQTNPRLVSLILSSNKQLTEKAVHAIAANLAETLEELELNSMNTRNLGNPTTIGQLTPLGKLRRLGVAFSSITDETLNNLCARLPNLETLDLSGTKLGLLGGYWDRWPNLSTLKLNGAEDLRDSKVRHIADKCPKLKRLSLTWTTVTEAGVKYAIDHLKLLESLDVSFCEIKEETIGQIENGQLVVHWASET